MKRPVTYPEWRAARERRIDALWGGGLVAAVALLVGLLVVLWP